MKMRNLAFVLAALLVACQPAPSGTAITNVTVIDAVNGVRLNRTVIFDGDEITAVQPADAEVVAAEIVDGTGKYLIPGLWDFHVHLTFDERFTEAMPSLFLSWGITSVRDTGGLMNKVLPVVESMRAEDAIAPRVFFAGPLLDGEFVVYDGESLPEIGVRNATPEDARTTIRRLAEEGVDFIKIYEMVSPDVFEAMVETANELGLPIDSHVPLSMRASIAGPSVDSIEHMRNLELECASDSPSLHEERLERLRNPDGLPGAELRASLHRLQRFAAIASYDETRCDRLLAALDSTMLVPTLGLFLGRQRPPYERADWDDALSRIPADAASAWRREVEERRANSTGEVDTRFGDWGVFLAGRAHAAGVPIGAGTDTPIGWRIPGYSLLNELELLVQAGLSPLEALASATLLPAEYFSLENEMGSVDMGKRADLLLLDADPLADINNVRSMSAVVTKGRYLTAEEARSLPSRPD